MGRRLYRWEDVQTKRLEDFTRVSDKHFDNARFPEGAIFTPVEKKRPLWEHPASFCSRTYPFSSFYVSFRVEQEKKWYDYWYWDDYVIVDKTELLNTLRSYGVELDRQ